MIVRELMEYKIEKMTGKKECQQSTHQATRYGQQ